MRPPQDEYDAVVVGARCAGATVATLLARAGRRVLLVDRAEFPSDTVSTHQLFPDSLDLLDRLGAGERVRAAHRLRPVGYSWRVLGHTVRGTFTPVGGHDRTVSIRRVALDAALVDTAAEAGALTRFGTSVADLVGSGTADDPVRGVVLDGGERVLAPWVVGADGRSSTVARRLGLPVTRRLRGEVAMLFAYWEGLPDSSWCRIDVQGRLGLMSAPCEDDVHLLSVAGPAELTRGTSEQRAAAYLAALRRFPAVLNPRLLDDARQVSPVVVVPETMLRGVERPATGPGWALVGDAGLFKHPVTAQGIGDALAQGWFVGAALGRGDDLRDYQAWRDDRAADFFEWSYQAARLPGSEAAALYSGLAADPVAGQEFLDTFSRHHRPGEVMTPVRRARWRAAWVYEQGLAELSRILEGLPESAMADAVPACPAWSVGDLLAHLTGVAQDAARGAYAERALDAWRDPALAERREAWTASHVDRLTDRSRDGALRHLRLHGGRLVLALRRGDAAIADGPEWLVPAPVGDLAVHVADLREALGAPADTDGPVARFGFAAYRDWLHARLVAVGLPAIRLGDGSREWVVGDGEPAGSVTAPRHELFRMVSGRRSAAGIRGYAWTTDVGPATDAVRVTHAFRAWLAWASASTSMTRRWTRISTRGSRRRWRSLTVTVVRMPVTLPKLCTAAPSTAPSPLPGRSATRRSVMLRRRSAMTSPSCCRRPSRLSRIEVPGGPAWARRASTR
ncbi:hypothetical protein GCM10023168_30750 [Fodinibacter luteus]|uniref:Uncharacterized protein n=1 Tax=Fodinibacter luteus TaxID=552064 RepID=A0ABP8KN57_9MICO